MRLPLLVAFMAASSLTMVGCDSMTPETGIATADGTPPPCNADVDPECHGGGGTDIPNPVPTYRIDATLIPDTNPLLAGNGVDYFYVSPDPYARRSTWSRLYASMSLKRCYNTSCTEIPSNVSFSCSTNGIVLGQNNDSDGFTDTTLKVEGRYVLPFIAFGGYRNVRVTCNYQASYTGGTAPGGTVYATKYFDNSLYHSYN